MLHLLGRKKSIIFNIFQQQLKAIFLFYFSQFFKQCYLQTWNAPHKINKPNALSAPTLNKISDILQNIIHVIESNGFTIQTLKPPELKGTEENIFPVQLSLSGPANQILPLLTHLSQDNWTIGIGDFSLQIENNDKANIEITLLILKKTVCENKMTPTYLSDSLKVIGYLHDAEHFFALLLLPDGKTQIVQQGSTIRDKNARIIGLSESEVIILQGQRQIKIKHCLH